MRGLPPLRVGLTMTVAAIFRGGEALGIDELAVVGLRVRREKGAFPAEVEVVGLGYFCAVSMASLSGSLRVRIGMDRKRRHGSTCEQKQHQWQEA